MFDKVKQIMAFNNLLCYPDFNNYFDTRTDARNSVPELFIRQVVRTILFYSSKFTVTYNISLWHRFGDLNVFGGGAPPSEN